MQLSFDNLSGNYLRTILRSFFRNRAYTLLNIGGLSLGFCVFMFGAIYVHFETSYESFHQNADRIYRATYRYTPNGEAGSHWARIPFDYINHMPEDVPGIESLVRFQNHARKYVRVGTQKFRPDHAYVADSEVFSVFNFKLVAGNPATALKNPYSVVLSRSLATEYFGEADPMGKEIAVIGDLDKAETLHHVTGIMEDLPSNTHLPVEMLISFKDPGERSGWAYTYILIAKDKNISSIEELMPAFVRKYSTEEEARHDAILFQSLRDIHLGSNLAREIVPGSRKFYVQIVGFGGLLILMIATINFMNLNSAMALGRAKEIGMRKIMGASNTTLVSYLLTEAVISCLIALVLGGLFLFVSFPTLLTIVPIGFVANPFGFTALMLAAAVTCGIVSGLYPVLLLTRMAPNEVVKTAKSLSFAGREGAFSLKRVMVTLQFCISIVLLGSALVANQQFSFLHKKNLGLTRDQIVAIPGLPDKVTSEFAAFKTELALQSGIAGTAGCMEVPSREIRDMGPVLVEGVNSDPSKAPIMDIQPADHDFARLMNLEFVAGRNFEPRAYKSVPEFNDDFTIQRYLFEQPREYLINETGARQLGWKTPEEAIGQKISWSIGDMALSPGPVIGVVRDYHQETLRNRVDPMILVYEPVWLRTFLVKVEPQNMAASLATIQSTWDKLFPLYPLEYHFLDELYNNLYKGERVQLKLMFIFCTLAIVIAFVGLVGLVAYSLKTRTRELAVRKVLGATIQDLTNLLSREYLFVLLIGGAVAVPLSVVAIRKWLDGFAYHVDISPWTYVITISIVTLLLLVTVTIQTVASSGANPAQTLREE